jgi:hypothetical protein
MTGCYGETDERPDRDWTGPVGTFACSLYPGAFD